MHHMSASAYLRDTATTQHDSDTDVGYGIPRNVLVSPRLGLIAHVDRMEWRSWSWVGGRWAPGLIELATGRETNLDLVCRKRSFETYDTSPPTRGENLCRIPFHIHTFINVYLLIE